MTGLRFCHVLAVLDDEPKMWAVLDRAIELADAERARLTLAKTTDPGWIVKWLGPLALLSRVAPPAEGQLEEFAGHQLARAAELVPSSISLSTLLLPQDTARGLARLSARGCYDLLVVRRGLVSRSPRLRRAIGRLDCCTLTVSAEPLTETDVLARSSAAARVART